MSVILKEIDEKINISAFDVVIGKQMSAQPEIIATSNQSYEKGRGGAEEEQRAIQL